MSKSECFALNYAQARECEECGTPFPVTESVSIEREASTIDIMGRDLIGEHWVTDHVVGIHHKKNSPPMLKIEYWSAIFPIATQYLCIYHPGYAGQKASEWFLNWTGFPVPRDIETAKQVLASTDDLPNRILVDSSGKYPQIKKWFYERQTERPPKACIKCGQPALMVRSAEQGMVNKGWYCPSCFHFDKPVGRERGL